MPEDTDEKRPADEADEAETDDERDEDEASTRAESSDDGDDGDEDERPAQALKKKSAARDSARPKKKKRSAPAKFVMPPEKEIGAPSRQTLLLLGVMVFATLVMWGSARFACNAHPAQTRKPREVSTADLSREPKDAALEMQQRWNSYDFAGALALAKGEIAAELQKSQAECERDGASCAAKKKAQEGKVLATAALLSRGPGSAKVRVTSRGGAMGEATVVYALEQEGGTWKVASKIDTPAPGASGAPAPSAVPAPSGSATP